MWRTKHVVNHRQRTSKLLFGFSLLSLFTCQVPRVATFLTPSSIPKIALASDEPSPCRMVLAYAPDTNHLDHTPIKYVRVNVHFVNSADSTKNYNWQEAQDFGPKLIMEANTFLQRNRKMWLPRGNATPVLPTRYRYVLTSSEGFSSSRGIYCHYDDALFSFVSRGRNRNNYSRDVIKKYGVGLDSIVNLFVMPHHPDSILSKTYKVTSAGIALGSGVKLSGIFETKKHPNAFRGLVNHEIGHVLGLKHTWNSNDGCDDTPRHSNCWNKSEDPPCDTAASNNLMDYNANQHAWTPCQIGKIHMNFSRENSLQRKMLQPRWCQLDPEQTIIIRDSIVWSGAKDLEGHLVIAAGASLEIRCRVSFPKGAYLKVAAGGTLRLRGARLHNACGHEWQGIQTVNDKNLKAQVSADLDTKIENLPLKLLRLDSIPATDK